MEQKTDKNNSNNKMKTTYKGFNIEECEGLNYISKAPKIQFYDPDDCDGHMFFTNSIDEVKEIIDGERK